MSMLECSAIRITGDKAHADPVIGIGRQIVVNIDIMETADIDAINASVASPELMHIKPTNLAEIMLGNRRFPLIESK